MKVYIAHIEHNSFGDQILWFRHSKRHTPEGCEVNQEGEWRNVHVGDEVSK